MIAGKVAAFSCYVLIVGLTVPLQFVPYPLFFGRSTSASPILSPLTTSIYLEHCFREAGLIKGIDEVEGMLLHNIAQGRLNDRGNYGEKLSTTVDYYEHLFDL